MVGCDLLGAIEAMFEANGLKFNYTFVLFTSWRTLFIELFLSIVLSPTNHIKLNVVKIHIAIQKGLAGSMVVCFHNGISNIEGMTQESGRRIPPSTKRRRDIVIVERVDLMLTTR